jgi:hypothetical protein
MLRKLLLIIFLYGLLVCNYLRQKSISNVLKINIDTEPIRKYLHGRPVLDDLIDFEAFDNEKGDENFIIPNVVHLIHFNSTQLKFDQMINIFSIYLNHNPDFIYIHCDLCAFRGHRWSRVMSIPGLKRKIVFKRHNLHGTIFRKEIDENWQSYHNSDLYRLYVLMNYGGI